VGGLGKEWTTQQGVSEEEPYCAMHIYLA
jgi:hypothetical protein